MPETPNPKIHPHPRVREKRLATSPAPPRRFTRGASYTELEVTTNFSFLTGASHPEELVEQAAELGCRAIAITDRNSLAGIVRAHVAAREAGIGLVVGARLELREKGPWKPGKTALSVLVHATDRASYGRLSRLLTLGKRRAPKGECDLTVDDLLEHAEGLLATLTFPGTQTVIEPRAAQALARLRGGFGDRLSVAASQRYGPDDRGWLVQVARLAAEYDVPLLATGDVHYHVAQRRALQDVVTCIRHGCSLDQAGFRLFANAERFLKPPEEMARLFAGYPHALARAEEIAERALGFSLDELEYQYPSEICPDGTEPMQRLVELTRIGARERYPAGVPDDVTARLEREFRLIDELAYAPYFLTVHDMVVFARSQGILPGRGAAANSAVCYCLGITAVDPNRIDLLFERFISKERDEPPDIDIDFEHERREEVIQYLYRKYGRDRAALTAEVITYRGRSAVREVGKALGLSLDCVDKLAKDIDWWSEGMDPEKLRELGLNPDDPTLERVVALTNEILGFPRHLSQHVGGFVITEGPLVELVPVENAAMEDRTVIEWDKDDIDAMGMLKIDVLGLGMLTCVRKCFDLVNEREGAGTADMPASLAMHTIPAEDPLVYDRICAADTVGVFQIESRAQMSMLPRLRPRCFYDLVIEVAIVRPGPIQGDMVHPYLRRRRGEEEVSYPKPEVKKVLEKTLGVPLFQEQAMALAIVAAGFTGGEADGLRRAMAAWKRKGKLMEKYGAQLIRGMLARGYPREFAERCFRQMQGFSEYGFPESHAASFALIVYTSAWLKCHYPAAFAAALINSQPMGFYAPAQIVRDAEEHGVEVRPVDVNRSQWDCTLEESANGDALRLGLRLVKGLGEEEGRAIAETLQGGGAVDTLYALRSATGASTRALTKLARADALQSLGLDRLSALWEVRSLSKERLPMFDELEATPVETRERPPLPPFTPEEEVLHDYATLHLSLKAHPISFFREHLEAMGVSRARDFASPELFPTGRWARVAGLVLVRQRPSTASGLIFMTLEDESGIANLIIRPPVYDRYRRAARHGTVLLAHGPIERDGEVVHMIARKIESLDAAAREWSVRSRDFH